MRLFKLFTLAAALVAAALLPGVASAGTLKGKVKKVSVKRGQLTVRSHGKTVKVRLASTARLSGRDRSHNGVLGLEDVKRGDRVAVKGSRRGTAMTASSLENLTTAIEGDNDGDNVPDNVDVIEASGAVVDLNPEQHVLTVEITSSEDESLEGSTIDITLPDGSLLIVGDGNRDRVRDWKDVRVGDRVLALLVDPVDSDVGGQALLVIDRDSLKSKKRKSREDENPDQIPMGGIVIAKDDSNFTVTVQPPLLDLDPVTVEVNEETKLDVEDTNEDGQRDFGDIQEGDQVRMLVDTSDPEQLVAVRLKAIVDEYDQDPGDTEPGDGEEPPAQDGPMLVGGKVQEIDASRHQVVLEVFGGPLDGQRVTLTFNAQSVFIGPDSNGDGVMTDADIQTGDRLGGLVQRGSQPGQALALMVTDIGPGEMPGDGQLPPPPMG